MYSDLSLSLSFHPQTWMNVANARVSVGESEALASTAPEGTLALAKPALRRNRLATHFPLASRSTSARMSNAVRTLFVCPTVTVTRAAVWTVIGKTIEANVSVSPQL